MGPLLFKEENGLLKKKSSSSAAVTPAVKKVIWDMYIGMGVQEAFCPLCGMNRIHQKTNSGFEAAHVIARKWFLPHAPRKGGAGKEQYDYTSSSAAAAGAASIYYLFPSCAACNNECADHCLLDYLYCRNRLAPLRRFIMAVFNTFTTEHQHELRTEERMAWLILDRLYGADRWKAGGGIQNAKAIYEIARVEQYHQLVQQTASLTKQLQEAAYAMTILVEADIKPRAVGASLFYPHLVVRDLQSPCPQH